MALAVDDRAPDFTLVDTTGEAVTLSALRGRPVVLVFLRWLGWLHCLEHLTQLRQRQAELEAHDAVVLVIAFEAERRVGGYCRRYQLPFRCLVDAERRVYRAYGLGRGSWRQTLTPRALAPYIRHIFSGRVVRSASHQDVRQRGGDFVVGHDGRIRLAYASDDPSDRPSVDAILAALNWPERCRPQSPGAPANGGSKVEKGVRSVCSRAASCLAKGDVTSMTWRVFDSVCFDDAHRSYMK
jgi:peroxiredoxin